MGMLMEATVPRSHRFIPKAMHVQYLGKATTSLHALAKLDPDVRSDMLHQLTTGIVGSAEHEAVAKLANAVLTQGQDEQDKLAFYREVMFKLPVSDTDDVALLMTRDLSRGEIAELPAEIRQNLHDQMNGGWVSAEEQVQVQKLADYLT